MAHKAVYRAAACAINKYDALSHLMSLVLSGTLASYRPTPPVER
jgi:hypothetical protein